MRLIPLAVAAAVCLILAPASGSNAQETKRAKPAETTAPASIDYTRYNQLVEENPLAMAGSEKFKDKWAFHYNEMSLEGFVEARQRIRIREAGLDRPKPKPRDLANYEKERRSALFHVPKCDKGTFSKEKGKCI